MRFSDRYSPIERAIHYLAFSAPFVQKALGELESDVLMRGRHAPAPGREVFITGLPRAGTTLLLELLYRTGEFCSFTYRHMPFILAPLISGRDLLAMGLDEGPPIGNWLRIVEEKQLEGELTTREEALRWLQLKLNL